MPASLLEPDLVGPYEAWKTEQTPQRAGELLKAVEPTISASLRTYGTQKSPTLRSRARILALDAISRYDPTKSAMKTHLMSQLQGLRRYAAKEQQILSVPEQVGLNLGHLRASENELQDKLGRDPSDVELADHTGLSLKRIAYIRKARPSWSESSMVRPSDEGEDVFAPAVQQRGTGVRQWHELVYHDLDGRDQLIMEHTFGMHGKPVLTNQLLAKKLGVSPGAVSQRRARIQAKLDLRDELKVI